MPVPVPVPVLAQPAEAARSRQRQHELVRARSYCLTWPDVMRVMRRLDDTGWRLHSVVRLGVRWEVLADRET